jgi:hypothetical protein
LSVACCFGVIGFETKKESNDSLQASRLSSDITGLELFTPGEKPVLERERNKEGEEKELALQ